MDGKLTLRLQAVDDNVAVTLDKVTGSAARTAAALGQVDGAGTRAEGGLRRAKTAATETSGAMDKLAKDVTRGVVAFAGFEVVKDLAAGVVDASSKMAGFRNTLEAATGSSEGAQAAMAFVRAESDRLGTSLEANTGAFAKFTAATRGTALAGAQTQRIFSAVSEAARALNLSADSTNGALLSLTQMVSKGNVQAEELRGQLGERLPGAFNLAAQAMGVTTAQLGKMLEAGQVTAADLLPKLATALHSVYGAQALVASNMPVAQIQRLQNAIFELKSAVGEAGFMDALAAGATKVTEAVTALTSSGALSTLLEMLAAVGAAIALNLGGRAVTAAASFAQGMIVARASTIATAEATATAAAALVQHTQAQARDAVATAEAITAARAVALARLEAANAATQEAARVIAATEAMGVQSAALAANAAAQQRLTVAQQARAASLAELAALGRAQVVVEGQMTVAAGAQIAATEASIVAQRGLAAATSFTSVALTGLATVGRTLFALVGGWPGLLVAAGVALYYLAQQTTELEDAARATTDATQELARAQGEQRDAAMQSAQADLEKKEALLSEAEAQLHAATAAGAHMNATNADADAFRRARMAEGIMELRDAVAGLRQEIQKTRMAEIMEGFERGPAEAAAFVREQQEAVATSVAGFGRMTAELEKQAATYGKGKVALVEYERAQAIAKISTALSADEQARLRAQIEEGSAAAMAAAKTYDATTAAKRAARDATKELREEQTRLNQLSTAEHSALGMIDSLEGELSAAAAIQAEYAKGVRDLQRDMEAWTKAGGDTVRITALWERGEKLLQQGLAKSNAELRRRSQLTSGNRDLVESIARQEDVLAGLDDAQVDYNAGVREANRLAEEAIDLGLDAQEVQAGLEDRMRKLAELRDAVSLDKILGEFAQESPFDKLKEQLVEVEKAMEDALGEGAQDKMERLQVAAGNLKHAMVTGIVDASQEGLRSLQSMTQDGSKAFQAFQIAIDALAVVQAISAVLNQGQGDPYTAFARMAAMAAAVAQLGVSIGNFGGGGGPSAESAEVRQARQGTGSILGDPEAKSESIANAVEITANATTQLVGLNRGMLAALQSLQRALGAAGNQLARGAGEVDFGGLSGDMTAPFGSAIGNAIIGWVHGGSQSVIDQGVIIAGGSLQDMLDRIVVGAYQTIETDGGLFGSDSTSEQVVGVDEEFARQFQLVIGSIVDTVREGALALGMLPEEIEAAIAAFRVEEIRISLSGLSADEQQAELEAVFSKLFDDLAAAVVPFISEFQQVGEGLGETLVRIATEVQVTQEAFRQLGIAVEAMDPLAYAQLADSLIQAAGGLDAFISGFQNFVQNFAPAGHQMLVEGEALTSAFAQVGLELPDTREGLWDMAQGLDLATEAGREQLATILRLADTADAYYDGLEDQAEQVLEAQQLLNDMGIAGGLSDFAQQLLAIADAADEAVEAANTLARAQGAEGASAYQVAQIHRWVAQQVRMAIEALRAQVMDLISQLYGGTPGTVDEVDRRIAEAGGSGFGGDTAGDVRDVGRSIQDVIERWADGIARIDDFLDGLLLNQALTTLTPEQQLAEAQSQYEAALLAAQAGDLDALAALPDLAATYLELARGQYSSGDQYQAIFDGVRDALGGLPDTPPGVDPLGSAGNPYQVGPSAELTALYTQRDALLAEQEAANRLQLAQQLAQHLNDLAQAINVPVLELAATMGVSLTELATDLGVDLENITGASVEAMASMAQLLGVSLTDLTQGLGLELTDLGAGVAELAASVGIDLTALTVQTTQSLADLAASLGVDVTELAESVGIDLGNLADSQSLLNQALHDQIDGLPSGIQDQLGPLLQAVEDATTEADANAAIQALADYVNELSPDIRDALAPYLEDVVPSTADPDVRELETANSWLSQILDETEATTRAINKLGTGMDLPGFAVGSAGIPHDMVARVHRGEKIIDANTSALLDRYGIRVTGSGSDPAVVAELRALRQDQAQQAEDNTRGLLAIAERVGAVESAQDRLTASQERLANLAQFATRN